MAFLLTPVFFIGHYKRWQKLMYAALIVFLIAMSESRGAWVYTAGMLCFVLILFLIRRFGRQESFLLVILVTTIAAVLIVIAFRSLDVIAPMMGKDASMSGRTEIYQQVWHSIMNPEADSISLSGWSNIGYSENGVLELALQLGIIGTALIVFMLSRAMVQAIRLLCSSTYSPQTGWFLTILFLAALTNIDAGWLLVPDKLDWVLILIACIGLEGQTRRARALRGSQLLAGPASGIRSMSV
jgi:O-antigen ligase